MESYSGDVFGAYGDIVIDTVAIGQVSVQSMAIGVAKNVGAGDWSDGILGLGFSSNCEYIGRPSISLIKLMKIV